MERQHESIAMLRRLECRLCEGASGGDMKSIEGLQGMASDQEIDQTGVADER